MFPIQSPAMAWFRNKPSNASTILRVRIGNRDVATICDGELPVEKQPSVELDTPELILGFTSSKGEEHVFDLTDAGQGYKKAHFSIRVHENFVVQTDCLLSNSDDLPNAQFSRGETPGLRFQPFFLSQSKVDPKEILGGGLFRRGLHFSGTVTPGNVSLLCVCDACRRSFHLQSFHAGFSNLTYFYCDSGIHTLTAPANLNDAPPVLGAASRDSLARFEATLPTCITCGGRFRYYNPLRCPHCTAPYIDFQRLPTEREYEYYGNYLFGDVIQSYSVKET